MITYDAHSCSFYSQLRCITEREQGHGARLGLVASTPIVHTFCARAHSRETPYVWDPTAQAH